MDVIEKAARAAMLTPVQRRILSQMHPGEFYDAYALCKQRRTRMALTNGGFTEPKRDGPVTSYWLIRITEKGLAALECPATPAS
jgi:hypothetical protein